MRRTKLKELLASGIHGSAPVTAEMIEPQLDHVSHTLPERRDNLSFQVILNPKKVNAADPAFGKSHSRRRARTTVTVWDCASQARAAGRYTFESIANSSLDCKLVLLWSRSYVAQLYSVMHHLRPPTLCLLPCLQLPSHRPLNSSRSESEIITCIRLFSKFFCILDTECHLVYLEVYKIGAR